MSDVTRAIAAAVSVAASAGLRADDAIILQDSNRLTLRLTPCDVLARVAPPGHQIAEFEVELTQRLVALDSPVGRLEPRTDPVVHERDGFNVTLWTYYEPTTSDLLPAVYAGALERLHAGMRRVDMVSPRFTDRIAEAEDVVTDPARSPGIQDAERAFLSGRLARLRRAIEDRGAAEQLLHGEPHAGNVLSTKDGALFIDLETYCRGPVEFDLAHAPAAVCEHYPNIDQGLLDDCREAILAMLAAWRCELGDNLPNGELFKELNLRALQDGPPWPTIDMLFKRLSDQQKSPKSSLS